MKLNSLNCIKVTKSKVVAHFSQSSWTFWYMKEKHYLIPMQFDRKKCNFFCKKKTLKSELAFKQKLKNTSTFNTRPKTLVSLFGQFMLSSLCWCFKATLMLSLMFRSNAGPLVAPKWSSSQCSSERDEAWRHPHREDIQITPNWLLVTVLHCPVLILKRLSCPSCWAFHWSIGV